MTDLIIVLKDGEVAEQGTHDSLLAQRGLYHDMWLAQQETTPLDGAQQAEAEGAERSNGPNNMSG
jgi:ABC-type transport system involved in cytochrome bd biosynthesis fused ATPase/permease subunit